MLLFSENGLKDALKICKVHSESSEQQLCFYCSLQANPTLLFLILFTTTLFTLHHH